MKFRNHQEGVNYLMRLAAEVGAERSAVPKRNFESFKPDLILSIGTREKMVVDYVHTTDSFSRDFTGMMFLMGEHRAKKLGQTYRKYYLVLSDEGVAEDLIHVEAKKRKWFLWHLSLEHSLFIIPVSEFQYYLRLEIEDMAKHILDRLKPEEPE